MQFDSVHNAKADIFQDVFGFQSIPMAAGAGIDAPLFAPLRDTAAFRNVSDGRKRNRHDVRDLVALGILPPSGHNGDPDGFKLGIFIQRAHLQDHPVVQEAQRHARGEARVIYTGPVRRRALNPGLFRPLRIGGSIGHYRISAGSIGCFCVHRDGGGIGILSNNHVLADTNKAKLGDIILQPGRKDGGRRQETNFRVATLHSFEDLTFDVDSRNLVDCAFATLVGGVEYDGGIAHCLRTLGQQWPIRSEPIQLLPGDRVKKVGRTTAETTGSVIATNVDNIVVAMGSGTGQRLARFDSQILIESSEEPFSKGGDSGALICSDDGRPAGLLFAGTDRGGLRGHGITYANPIEAVLDTLNLDIHIGR